MVTSALMTSQVMTQEPNLGPRLQQTHGDVFWWNGAFVTAGLVKSGASHPSRYHSAIELNPERTEPLIMQARSAPFMRYDAP